jgi:transposase
MENRPLLIVVNPGQQRRAGHRPFARRTDDQLHVAGDALGNPLRVILSAGQIADIAFAANLIDPLPVRAVIADKGYDAGHFVATIAAAGAQAVIPTYPGVSIRNTGMRVFFCHVRCPILKVDRGSFAVEAEVS